MSIISKEFFLFVILLVFLYYTLFKNKKAWVLLLIASYTFYIVNNPINLIYLMVTTISVFIGTKKIEGCNFFIRTLDDPDKEIKKQKRHKLETRKKRILLLLLIINFGMLSIFKYSAYVYSLIGAFTQKFPVFGFAYSENVGQGLLNLLQPLGISFYIFQAIGYTIDVYKSKYEAEKNLFKVALFLSYFPQMVQGPIGRWDELSVQFFSKPKPDYDNIRKGILLISFGLLKKMIVANGVAPIVNAVFSDCYNYTGAFVFVGVIIYGIQIYTDFSGGIDIVRGVSYLFGIRLAENFKQPFFSTSLADFWRRWHITLGTWLKDYVFYALNFSKVMTSLNKWSRKKLGVKYGKFFSIAISTFIIYFIVGIWHGPGFKFIAFGIWHGSIISLSLVLEESFVNFRNRYKLNDSILYKLFMIIRTNLLVTIGRYFSRASGYKVAKAMLIHTFSNFDISGVNMEVISSFGIEKSVYIKIFIALLIMVIYGVLAECKYDINEILDKRGKLFNIVFIFLIALFLVVTIFYQDGYVATEFIYRQY